MSDILDFYKDAIKEFIIVAPLAIFILIICFFVVVGLFAGLLLILGVI